MPDPATSRLALYKSKSDGSELVNYTTDLGQNWDKVDAAAGFQVVTSSTRPSSPYPGKPITESDTSYRSYFSNGTAPASASWVEIPNSSGTFGGNLTLATGSSLSIGAATLNRTAGGSLSSNTNYQSLRTLTTDVAFSTILSGDTFDRGRIYGSGMLELGPGNAARDTNLYRSAADTLKTDDSLIVGAGLTVTSTTWTTYTPTVTNGGSVTWTTRTGYYYKLGKIVFVCIFLNSNAAGSGTGLVSVDMPSTVDRSTRQALTLHGETIGANGSAASSIRGGECMFFTGGTGGTSDRLRVDNGTSNESNIQGADILANALITIQGWYREA